MNIEPKAYTVTFRNYPNFDNYVEGLTILEAIENARDLMFDEGHPTPYLTARARPTVYKEWNNKKSSYRNDGTFIS